MEPLEPTAASYADGVENIYKRNPLPLSMLPPCDACRIRPTDGTQGDCRKWSDHLRQFVGDCLCQQNVKFAARHAARLEPNGDAIEWYNLRPTKLLYLLASYGFRLWLDDAGRLQMEAPEEVLEEVGWVVDAHAAVLTYHLTPKDYGTVRDPYAFDPEELEKIPLTPSVYEFDGDFDDLAGILEFDGGADRIDAEREARRIIRIRRAQHRERFRKNLTQKPA